MALEIINRPHAVFIIAHSHWAVRTVFKLFLGPGTVGRGALGT